MLEQLDLKGGGPHPMAILEAVEHVMKCDGRPYAAVEDDGNHLPEDLHEAYPPKISAPFQDQDNGLPRGLFGEMTVAERRMDEVYHLQPVGGKNTHLRCYENIRQNFILRWKVYIKIWHKALLAQIIYSTNVVGY